VYSRQGLREGPDCGQGALPLRCHEYTCSSAGGLAIHMGSNGSSPEDSPRIRVVDFFSGCGGTSAGLQAAGAQIVLGIDKDSCARATFTTNFPGAAFFEKDVRKLRTAALAPFLDADQGGRWLFSACAPCQPFSRQRRDKRENDDRAPLLWELIRFVRRYRPSYVFVENVPGLQSLSQQLGPFDRFVAALERFGYSVGSGIVEAMRYGVPQRRGRLVLIASRLGSVQLPLPTHGPNTPAPKFSTVWEWIGDLPPIAAGEVHASVPNHRSMRLSPLNLKRIRATPEGGGRKDWPKHLRLRCHSNGYRGHSDVYGRMRKHLPASGLTTRCLSLSNGRFGHPTQDRAISVREAASLQTFPRDFIFHGSLEAMATQIGNAVPVLLAQRFGDWFVEDARRHGWSATPERTHSAEIP
jgi:DNA (cytosine-5)-methyltransferase 1